MKIYNRTNRLLCVSKINIPRGVVIIIPKKIVKIIIPKKLGRTK